MGVLTPCCPYISRSCCYDEVDSQSRADGEVVGGNQFAPEIDGCDTADRGDRTDDCRVLRGVVCGLAICDDVVAVLHSVRLDRGKRVNVKAYH